MRAILILVLIVVALALVGWLTFNHDPERPGINLETQKMKDDTKKVMENGSELLKKAERSIDPSANPADAPQSSGAPAR